MKAAPFIARKLRFKGRLAVIAVAVSFFVMIISIAISSGFRKEIRSGVSAISGDIQLSAGSEPIDIAPSYRGRLDSIQGVQSIIPAIWKPGIVRERGEVCGVMVKGIPMPDSCSLQAQIPSMLARKMKLSEGDAMTVWFVDEKVRARRFKVSQIYDGIVDSDKSLVIRVPLTDMQRLCGWTAEQAGTLEVMLEPEWNGDLQARVKADEMYITALEAHGEDEEILRATTTRQRYPQLFDWLDLIDFNVFAILLLMTIVAGFNMISGLLILLFRHISTIGTLKALGMTDKSISRVFLRVAARIVLIGMAIGNGAALLFCLLQDKTHLIKLNPVNYFVSFVPVSVQPGLILAIDAGAFLLIMILLLIPSLFIAKVDPAETVRIK